MANSQFTLTSKLHEKNICSGLSNLQQNGEFVDMTLAADGHFVRVHQIIIALASPYIKDLISSAQCQHPVIFLNKISHTTLAAILEYVYTGEVLVTVENLKELVEAGKELHIKGLEDMHLQSALVLKQKDGEGGDKSHVEAGDRYLDEVNDEETEQLPEETSLQEEYTRDIKGEEIQECQETFLDEAMDEDGKLLDGSQIDDEECIEKKDLIEQQVNDNLQRMGISKVKVANAPNNEAEANALQYTVSNQGSLQMILNRYMYYLKYTNRNKSRQWRCVDYLKNIRCPALVITQDDVVIKRIAAHTHSFHDQKILKKLRAGAIFTAVVEAERQGESLQQSRDLADDHSE
ncbi:uncharacterized protein [Battus philenor]|uniref:uncharacterized protein n=1 Tax=Battus philenor TaxID=42288 RepID=UPI0035D0E669